MGECEKEYHLLMIMIIYCYHSQAGKNIDMSYPCRGLMQVLPFVFATYEMQET